VEDIVKLTKEIFTLKEKLFQTYQTKRRKMCNYYILTRRRDEFKGRNSWIKARVLLYKMF